MPPTEVYLVRHAIAAERGGDWPDDTKRPLTRRGVERFQQVVQGLGAIDVAIEEIFTSPLVRAVQTADLLAAGLPGTPPVRRLDALAPGHPPAVVVAALGKAARHPRVAVVGHEPGLGELAAHLIAARRPLVFRKGGVCRIDMTGSGRPAAGSLVWFLPPRVLRRLAG